MIVTMGRGRGVRRKRRRERRVQVGEERRVSLIMMKNLLTYSEHLRASYM